MRGDILVLVIDNYDSSTYNIVHILAEHGARSVVVRNDEVTVSGVERMNPDRVILSPGPGDALNPRDVGVTLEVVRRLGPRIPVLGISLGHHVVGLAYGARVRRARTPAPGRVDVVEHYGDKLFHGVPRRFNAMRYHTLVLDDPPGVLTVTARSAADGDVMAVRHPEHPVHGVQFNPESVATPHGSRILGNFLDDPW